MVLNFTCKTCSTVEVQEDDSPRNIVISGEEFETIPTFCNLGDVIGQSRGCPDAANASIHSAWKAFHELLPILSNPGITLVNRGNVFTTSIQSVLLCRSETWFLSKEDLYRVITCDFAMIH